MERRGDVHRGRQVLHVGRLRLDEHDLAERADGRNHLGVERDLRRPAGFAAGSVEGSSFFACPGGAAGPPGAPGPLLGCPTYPALPTALAPILRKQPLPLVHGRQSHRGPVDAEVALGVRVVVGVDDRRRSAVPGVRRRGRRARGRGRAVTPARRGRCRRQRSRIRPRRVRQAVGGDQIVRLIAPDLVIGRPGLLSAEPGVRLDLARDRAGAGVAALQSGVGCPAAR